MIIFPIIGCLWQLGYFSLSLLTALVGALALKQVLTERRKGMSIANIISICTSILVLMIIVYSLGERRGYQRGFNDGKYKTLITNLEEIKNELHS